MKLRTKILWISCLAVLAATLISGGMILGMTAENLKNEAVLKAYQNFYELAGEMNNGLTNINQSEMIQTWLEYFFKTNKNINNRRDDYTICFYRTDQKTDGSFYKEIYNHTTLSVEELYNLDYKVYADYFYNLTIFPKVNFVYLPLTISYYNYEGFSSSSKDEAFAKIVDNYIRKQNGLLAWFLRKFYLLYKYCK